MEILIAYHVRISERGDSLTLLSSISLQVSHAKTLLFFFFFNKHLIYFPKREKKDVQVKQKVPSCVFWEETVCIKFSGCFIIIKRYFGDVNSRLSWPETARRYFSSGIC